MNIGGLASKKLSELVKGDLLYYIDPKEPTKIKELAIKGVSQYEGRRDYVKVEYYQTDQFLKTVDGEIATPTRYIVADRRSTSFISMSQPQTIYHTNKKQLQKWMDGR